MRLNKYQMLCNTFFGITFGSEILFGIWVLVGMIQDGQVRDDPFGTAGGLVITAIGFAVIFVEELVCWSCTHYLLREKTRKTSAKIILSAFFLVMAILLIACEVYWVISLYL